MGITTRAHMHAHTHAPFSPPLIFYFFHCGEDAWMDAGGGAREGPPETNTALASSPPTPPRLPFVSAYIQTSWHTLCLWGGSASSLSHTRFSCPPQIWKVAGVVLIKLYSLHLITKWMAQTSTWRVICLTWVTQIKTPSHAAGYV